MIGAKTCGNGANPIACHWMIAKKHYTSSMPMSAIIVDVPVKITVLQGDEILQEYEDVIALHFDTETVAGRDLGKRMATLALRDGLSAKDALFAIACDEILAHPGAMLQRLADADLVKRIALRKIRLRVTLSGEISRRKPVKQ